MLVSWTILLIYQYQIFKSMKKEWTEAITNFKILYNCNTASTCTVWLHAAHTTDQLSSSSCWTGVIQKSLSLNEKYWRIFLKKFRRKDQQAEEDKIERVTGLGRRTREEIAKWNQMTALRFQTGELVSWCFEPSQPQRISSGLNTNFTLSAGYSFHKSSYHK